jgi:hypothetical protein
MIDATPNLVDPPFELTPPEPRVVLHRSKAQIQFDRFWQQLEARRKELVDLEDILHQLQQRTQNELLPLVDRVLAQEKLQIQLIAGHLEATVKKNEAYTKRQKKNIEEVLVQLCEDFLAQVDDPEIQELHERYCEFSLEEIRAIETEALRDVYQGIFGKEIPGATTLEEVLAQAEQMFSQDGQANSQTHKSKKVKPSGKTASAKKLIQEKEASLSLRAVYRQLASALHPDRIQDETLRAKSTVLMQEANMAYEKKDLLTLLTLQLQIEQINEHQLRQLSEEKLTHFSKILKDQVKEVELEIQERAGPYFAVYTKGKPALLMSYWERDKKQIKAHQTQLEAENQRLRMRREAVLSLVAELYA